MPIKKATAPKRSAPRKARTAPKPAPARPAEPAIPVYFSGTPLSREEKRQIILAHAAARQPTDPVQVTSMWVGVAACAAIVAVGWWWAVKPEISRSFEQGLKPALTESSQTVSALGDSIKSVSENKLMQTTVNGAGDKLQQIKDHAALQAETKQAMQRVLGGEDTGQVAPERDLFNPSAVTVVTGTPAANTQNTSGISQP
jgi:hypothetical protein